jgi:integrase
MASIKRHEGPRGPRWEVRWRLPDGREASRRFDRAGVANDFLDQLVADKRRGYSHDPSGPQTLFSDMAAKWAGGQPNHKDTTAATVERELRLHILPALGELRLSDCTKLVLQGFQKDLHEKGLAPSSVLRIWTWTAAILKAAVEEGLIPAAPQVKRPPMPKRAPLVPLEPDQVERLIAALPPWYRAAAQLAADAGLRNAEVFGLTVGRSGTFLARQRELRVERQLIIPNGADPYLRRPKYDHERVVPLPDDLIEALARHLHDYPDRPVVYDAITKTAEPLVFGTATGKPVHRSIIDSALRQALKRAKLFPGVRFHDLRHYYASVLIAKGASERKVAQRLGHSSTQITQTYGHLFRGDDEDTRRVVEASIQARRRN